MSIKATIGEVRQAYQSLSALNEQTKLSAQSAWSVARMLRKMKGHVKDFEKSQMKVYRDAGGMVVGNGVEIPALEPRGKDESLADFESRRTVYRDKLNGISDEMTALNEETVEIDLEPLKLSLFPVKRKNDKGEEVEVEYNANLFAHAGPFIQE